MSDRIIQQGIELIAGLKPANNNTYPLAEAQDIVVDSDNTRLDEKIAELEEAVESAKDSVNEDTVSSIVNSAILSSERIGRVETTANDNANAINALVDEDNGKLALLQQEVNKAKAGDNEKLVLEYNATTSQLSLINGEELLNSVTIQGGGGSGATSNLSLKVLQQDSNVNILYGDSCSLTFTPKITSSDETENVDGQTVTSTLYVSLDGITYTPKDSITVLNNNVGEFDVTPYLRAGTSYFRVTTVLFDEEGQKLAGKNSYWTVYAVDLSLEIDTNSFTEEDPYTSNATIGYTARGGVERTVYCEWVSGGEIATQTISNTNSLYKGSFNIPKQPHGSYLISLYCKGIVNGREIKTEKQYISLLFLDNINKNPIIGIKYPQDSVQQYTAVSIPYVVYTPSKTRSNLTIQIGHYDNDEFIVDSSVNQTVDSTTQTFLYQPNNYGVTTFKFISGTVEKEFALNVEKFPYDISVVPGASLDFNAIGRSNTDDNYNEFILNEENILITENFDWNGGGWQLDDEGNQCFVVKAGSKAILDYKPFEKALNNGLSLKVIYKIKNVADTQEVFFSCFDEDLGEEGYTPAPVGVMLRPHRANWISGTLDLQAYTSEEDKIELDFNVFGRKYLDVTKDESLILSYEDGTPSRAKVYSGQFNSQRNPQNIVIGSNSCDVYIYELRVYQKALTNEDVKLNFIADASTGAEKADRYTRNLIYKDGDNLSITGTLDPDVLAALCPDLRVIKLSAPTFTTSKKVAIEGTTVEQIYKNGGVLQNWKAENEDNKLTHRGQGTSSEAYGPSARNLDVRFTDNTVVTFGDGTTGTKIKINEDSIPANQFYLKLNVASSENANNACLQNRYNEFLPYQTLAQATDPRVKNAMEWAPCVVFIQETDEDLSKHIEFNDTNWHFYGIGNIGDSKKTDKTRVFNSKDDKEFCVEIMDCDRPLATFPTLDRYSITVNTGEKDGAGKDVFASYLVDKATADSHQVGGLYNGLTITEIGNVQNILRNEKFNEKGTYGLRYATKKVYDEDNNIWVPDYVRDTVWIPFYNFVIKDLTPNYTIYDWVEELDNWFIMDSALYYFLFTLRYTMVDNRAKNSFYHWTKYYITEAEAEELGIPLDDVHVNNAKAVINEGYRFEFWDYDNDTSLGIDNAGVKTMDYGVEDDDKDENGNFYFRNVTESSTFFDRIREGCKPQLAAMYQRLNQAGSNAFSAISLINEFDKWQGVYPEELWKLDFERKYLRTYTGQSIDNSIQSSANGHLPTATYLEPMMNGRKKYDRHQWERDQAVYMASKFTTAKVDDYLKIRCQYGPSPESAAVVPADYSLQVIPYSDCYLHVWHGEATSDVTIQDGINSGAGVLRVKANQEGINIRINTQTAPDFIYIYPASKIRYISNLSALYPSEIDISPAEKLVELSLGNSTPGYKNTNLTGLAFSENNSLLNTINIENLDFTGTLGLDVLKQLEYLYAKGSSISAVSFANGGMLKEAHLPNTVTEITMKNLKYLEELDMDSYSSLQELNIQYCDNLNTFELMGKNADGTWVLPYLYRLRLLGVDWAKYSMPGNRMEDSTILNRLYSLKGYDDSDTKLSDDNTSVISGNAFVANLEQEYDDKFKERWPELKITYGNYVKQHPVYYKDHNGNVLYTWYGAEGLTLIDPVAEGYMSTPSKESDAQYTYVFSYWGDAAGKEVDLNSTYVIDGSISVFAQYTPIVRTYGVTWYNYDGSIYGKLNNVEYGTSVECPIQGIPTRSPSGISGALNTFYLFKEWDTDTRVITGETAVRPIWYGDGVEGGINVITKGLMSKDVSELKPEEMWALTSYMKLNGGSNGASQVQSLTKDGKQLWEPGTTINVQMGYLPDGDETDLRISSETSLNGVNATNTKMALFKEGEEYDWTMAIDFKAEYSDSSTNRVLVGCYDSATSTGFRLAVNAQGHPVVTWGTNSTANGDISLQVLSEIGSMPNRIATSRRDIVIIKHKKNSKNLEVFSNNRYSLSKVKHTTLTTNTERHSNYCLGLGGSFENGLPTTRVSETGNQKVAKGTLYNVRFWKSALSDEECEKMASWIYEEVPFRLYSTGLPNKYTGVDGISTQASFVAKDLLDDVITYHNTNDGALSFSNSFVCQWLNEKLIKAFPPVWRNIFTQVNFNMSSKVYLDRIEESKYPSSITLQGEDLRDITEIESTPCYLTIPTAKEMNMSSSTVNKYPYLEEGLGTSVELYSTDNSRVKTLLGKPYAYFTASLRTTVYISRDIANNTLNSTVYSYAMAITAAGGETASASTTTARFGVAPCFHL